MMDMKLKRTVIPVVAVALAALLVAPGCDKKNDKEDPKPANSGVTNNTGSNSGSNNSQNSGNSGQTDPQQPELTPEQSKAIVERVKPQIRDMALNINLKLHTPEVDIATLEKWLDETKGLKKELEKLPETNGDKAKLLKNVNLLADASQAGIDYRKAKEVATEPDTKGWEQAEKEVQEKKDKYASTETAKHIEKMEEDKLGAEAKETLKQVKELVKELEKVKELGRTSTEEEVLKHRETLEKIAELHAAIKAKPEQLKEVDPGQDLVPHVLDYSEKLGESLKKAEENKKAKDSQAEVKELEKKMNRLRADAEFAI